MLELQPVQVVLRESLAFVTTNELKTLCPELHNFLLFTWQFHTVKVLYTMWCLQEDGANVSIHSGRVFFGQGNTQFMYCFNEWYTTQEFFCWFYPSEILMFSLLFLYPLTVCFQIIVPQYCNYNVNVSPIIWLPFFPVE